MKHHQAEEHDHFLNRINQHPKLKARFGSILDLAENTDGGAITADEAEMRAIAAVRQLGNEVLQEWANGRIDESSEQLKSEEPLIEKNGKKTSMA
jgi:hypothetical protein